MPGSRRPSDCESSTRAALVGGRAAAAWLAVAAVVPALLLVSLVATRPSAVAVAAIVPVTTAAWLAAAAYYARRPRVGAARSACQMPVTSSPSGEPLLAKVMQAEADAIKRPDSAKSETERRPAGLPSLPRGGGQPVVRKTAIGVTTASSEPRPVTAAAGPVVVIRVADPVRGCALETRLASGGYAATTVDTTDELYTLLNRDRVDVLVIEDRLPGFLTGLDIIERFHKELLRPQVVLLVDAGRDEAARIRAVQPATALPATAGLGEIAAAVKTALAQAGGGPFLPVAARRVVAGRDRLRPMPQLVVKLAGYLAADAAEISIDELARHVSSDPSATIELLRFTNGAALGLRRRVTSVSDAVALLGPRRVISLLVAGAAVGSAGHLLRGWPEPLRAWYQRRSVLTAAGAQAFARIEGVSPETAFLLGLLQDLGVAVLADAENGRYAKIVERYLSVPLLTLPMVERVELGYTHADVSAALLQKWELPASMIAPVLAHHADDPDLSKAERAFVRAMRIGEALADLTDLRCPQRRQTLNRLLSRHAPAGYAACRAAVTEAVTKAVEASRLFALPEPDADTLRRLDEGLLAASAGEDGGGPGTDTSGQ